MTVDHTPTSNDLATERTDLAADRTSLAIARTVLAHDRTLMAWVRTAISLISFGFTIYKFFQYVAEEAPTHPDRLLTPRAVGLIMITIGVGSLVMATWDYRRQTTALHERYRAYGPFDRSIAAAVATVVSGLGIIGFVLVFLHQ
jgi:putative membrane protein